MARQQRQFPQGKYILRTPRKSQNGQVYAVYLYYYWLGKQVRRSVDLTVALKDWNQDANGGAGEFRPNYKERNAYLRELMPDIDSKIMDYIKQHGEIDGDTIEAFVSGDDKVLCSDNGIDFIEFAKQRFIDRYNSGKIGVSSINTFTTEKEPDPIATTGDYSNVTMTSATVTCTYENVPEGGVCGVEYSWNGGSTKQVVGSSNGTQQISLSGLSPSTNYIYCAYIEANGQTYYGSDKTFTTGSPSLAGTWSCSITRNNGDTESWSVTLTENGKGSAKRTNSDTEWEASWTLSSDGHAYVGIDYIVSTPQRFSYQTYDLWGTVNSLENPSSISGDGEYRVGNDITESGPNSLKFSMSK